MSSTAAQQNAVAARGNVLVMAGAGTGKTSTLVERCVNCLCDLPRGISHAGPNSGPQRSIPRGKAARTSLDELLVVTFTDAAAAEVRKRIRGELEKRASQTGEAHWAEQVALFDTAPIGTLHSFCFKLIQQHFHELGLDAQLKVLDEGQARLMANETLAAVLQEHYDLPRGITSTGLSTDSPRGISRAEPNSDSPRGTSRAEPNSDSERFIPRGEERFIPRGEERSIPRGERIQASEAVRRLIQTQAGGRDKVIRTVVLRLHHHAQTRPNPGAWLAAQLDLFASPAPERWREWLREGIADWRARWKPALTALGAAGNGKAMELAKIVGSLPEDFSPDSSTERGLQLASSDAGEAARGINSALLPPQVADVLNRIRGADADWRRKKTAWRPALKSFFDEAAFLASLADSSKGTEPLAEDWEWTRDPMTTLLHLAQEFSARFSETKRETGVVDFHDLEQFALQLLWDFSADSPRGIRRAGPSSDSERSIPRGEPRGITRAGLSTDSERSIPRGEPRGIASAGLSTDAERSIPRGKPTAIARHWRKKIRFVFVDEYQDINAAQDQIIAALSRDGADANRFLVGDVKQSIYRFRQADPQIFRDYAVNWRGSPCGITSAGLSTDSERSIPRGEPRGITSAGLSTEERCIPQGDLGQTIPLAENFRSREGVLQFVNSVFAVLMRSEIGGVAYDDEAKLRFGAPGERQPFSAAADPAPRAELILRLKGGNQSSGEADDAPTSEVGLAEMEDAEKEARLVALRLRELIGAGHQIWDKDKKVFRNVEYGDMAVLLRAPANKAESYAKEFTKLGVPLIVERGGFFQSTEITDLLSLLQVLDNPLQDLPLLAVLRSPLVGLSLDELATIRLAAHGHFWTALSRWRETSFQFPVFSIQESETADHATPNPHASPSPELARRVELFFKRFSHWRKLARQTSLSRCLETVLAETHYAGWLRTQQRGEQRHANVQKLLGLAQHFDQFQRQGLFRFLRFIEAQQEAEAEPEVAPSPEQDAVRLMSIHQSKGLEFPVVVVADLGKRFNEQDLRAEIILDEVYGLCPQIKPPHSGRRYPSLPWWLAQLRQRRELRGEELRLLYVAMTRARDTLILTGSITAKKWESHWRHSAARDEVTAQSILTAQSYADWLGLWFAQHADAPAGQVPSSEGSGVGFETDANEEMNANPPPTPPKRGAVPHLRWSLHDDSRLIAPLEGEANGTTQGADAFILDAETERKLRNVLTWEYPFGAATRRPAKTSVTALRRQAVERDEEAQPLFGPERDRSPVAEARQGVRRAAGGDRPRSNLPAADIGLAHHNFLEHVALEQTLDADSLQREAQRLGRARLLTPEEIAALDFNALAAFWASDIGRKIRDAAPHVRRELAFTARFSPQELAAITGEELDPGLDGEFVVVQGVADLVVLLRREIWLVDFKTDEVEPGELAAKARIYEPQLKLYAQALSRIYQRPVTECWLQFLARQKTVRIKV